MYIEDNGLLIFEAEHTLLPEGWLLDNKIGNYSGDGYITWVKPTTTETKGQGLLTYHFYISKEGNYTLKFRNFHPCEDVTECNDVFVKIDDDVWKKNFNHTFSQWDWNSRQDVEHVHSDAVYHLVKGKHTLYFSGRSQDFSIDKITLFHADTPNGAYKNAELSTYK